MVRYVYALCRVEERDNNKKLFLTSWHFIISHKYRMRGTISENIFNEAMCCNGAIVGSFEQFTAVLLDIGQ